MYMYIHHVHGQLPISHHLLGTQVHRGLTHRFEPETFQPNVLPEQPSGLASACAVTTSGFAGRQTVQTCAQHWYQSTLRPRKQ